MSFFDSVVLITGASSGIGFETAKAFAKRIHEGRGTGKVLITGRSKDRLLSAKDKINSEFPTEVVPYEFDVSNREATYKTVDEIHSSYGCVDILVNNAGLGRGLEPLWECDPNGWDEMINTNLVGVLNVTRNILGKMVENEKGHIITIGSTAGHCTYPGGNVYNATKNAVVALSRAIRKDVEGKGVRVTSIDPGMVETNFSNVRFHGDVERASKVYEGKRALQPSDIAELIIFSAERPAHVSIDTLIATSVDQKFPL